MKDLDLRVLHGAAAIGALLIAVTLWNWGQPLISTSGEFRLWVNSIWSRETSQQVADWYTLSHLIHGMLVALIGIALRRWIPFWVVFASAIVTGVTWEIVEHTEWVLGQFRGQTIYQGYVGDTVLNAVCDYLFMLAGFAFAALAPWRWGVFLVLLAEILSATLVRDSLVLTTIRVVHPIPAVTAWQDAGNPNGDWAGTANGSQP